MVGREIAALFAWLALPLSISAAEPKNLSRQIDDHRMPYRVHVFEDYETEIERRWWLRGSPATDDAPASLSNSVANRRYCVAGETTNFDRKMEDQQQLWKAVIFNPVPGPPMAGHTRLRFRYKLSGTDQLRVQIYSLSNGYHRYLMLTDLPQNQWQLATVDLTQARRPDGSGGPLAADERIDDIQFYIPPDAELAIDDIVLYEPARAPEPRPFPGRVIFTAWFDTGKQGNEWPGEFEIELHEKPRGWDAAKNVVDEKGRPRLRVGMRGQRTLSQATHLSFRYRLKGADVLPVALVNTETGKRFSATLDDPTTGQWSEATLSYETSPEDTADSISFELPRGAELWVDDLLLYEP